MRRALKGVERGLFFQRPVRPHVVVVGTEGVQLELQVAQRLSRGLLGEELLQGLVEAFDLAAGLRVVGGGVLALDAQPLQF